MRALAASLTMAWALSVSAAGGCAEAESGLPTVRVQVGDDTVIAEVASTEAQRARGLMYRRKLGRDRGMLFVYPKARTLSFWMKNTYVPLTIAYLDADRHVVDLVDMAPRSTAAHPSSAPARYALEMQQGWFAQHGVAVGDRVEFTLPDGIEPDP
jgi:uncharacterized membrane protein (UPF0127 family)